MIQGSPLYYTHPLDLNGPAPSTPSSEADFNYFNRFFVGDQTAVSHHHTMQSPPHSASQSESESESSVSSVEILSKKLKCCWRNCGLHFDTLDLLASHVSRVHGTCAPGGLFFCGWEGCERNDRGFNARYKMLVHVRTHTNEKPHRCYQCNKSFSRAENLKIHIRSHSGEKPYQCPVPGCTKAYSNSSDRFKHTRTHQVDKPYQCKVSGCSKRYTDPSSLRKHVKTFKHFVVRSNENNTSDKSDVVVPLKICECNEKKDVLISLKNLNNNSKYLPPSKWSYSSSFDMDVVDSEPLDLSVVRKS